MNLRGWAHQEASAYFCICCHSVCSRVFPDCISSDIVHLIVFLKSSILYILLVFPLILSLAITGQLLSSRRAKRDGWPKGPKGPERAFRPFGLAVGGPMSRQGANVLGTPLAPFEPWGGPRGADWRPKHFHILCLGGTHPYQVLGPLNGPLRHS